MPITVQNRSRTLFTLNLARGVDYGEPHASTKQTLRLTAHSPDGTVGMRIVERELPASITWLAGEVKSKLPQEVQDLPEFQRACDAGILRVVEASK